MKRHFKSLEELVTFLAAEGRGRAFHQIILHDDACTPSICVCQPEFVLEDLTVENYKEGQEAEKKWKRENTQ